jgi:diacylglycerol O-acyltransferase / wax synthase
MTREHMSPVDVAWLRMDRPTNLMVIVGVMTFDGPLEFAMLRQRVAERFAALPRFRARPVDGDAGAFWEEDPDFDLDAHLHRTALPAPAGQAELEALAGELACTELDHRRPLWEFHLVENHASGAAVILRIHHCYADGMALMDVFLGMTDEPPPPPPAAPRRRRRRGPLAWIGELPVPGSGLVERALAAGGHWMTRLAEFALHPRQANELAQHAVALLAEATRVALLPPDPPTPLKGRLGRRKRIAWGEERLPLDEVATVARAHGCKINDVLMATAAGALGDYLQCRGVDTRGLTIRATVPVNLRRPEDAPSLGNAFGLVFLDLPVGIADPLARLRAVQAAMDGLKQSYQPLLMLGLLGALGLMPGRVETAAIDLLSVKATLVASNVAGPRQAVHFGGRRITGLVFWVPQSGQLAAGISLMSYDGAVQFGLLADARRVPDPRAVVARFPAAFEKLVLATLLGPLDAPSRRRATPARPSPARRRGAPSRPRASTRPPSGRA